jgi:hypothetical protein
MSPSRKSSAYVPSKSENMASTIGGKELVDGSAAGKPTDEKE